jgi:hypothetical protein
MKTPFGEFIEDENIPEGTFYIINQRYKTVQVNQGEPPILKEVLDIEATANASLVIKNIGTGKENK